MFILRPGGALSNHPHFVCDLDQYQLTARQPSPRARIRRAGSGNARSQPDPDRSSAPGARFTTEASSAFETLTLLTPAELRSPCAPGLFLFTSFRICR